MNKNLARFLFLFPLVAGFLGAFHMFGDRHLPPQAQQYFEWFVHQPHSDVSFFFNRLAFAGLVGLALSTIGLLFFWKPAKYIYVLSLLLVLPDQAPAIPVLVTGFEHFLDNLVEIMVGLNIGLIFSQPVSSYFSRQKVT
jgi:hypothetical protein